MAYTVYAEEDTHLVSLFFSKASIPGLLQLAAYQEGTPWHATA